MPNQTMVYSCSGAEQEYTMVWFGIFLYLLVSSLKIRFCEQSVFTKSPLQESITALEMENTCLCQTQLILNWRLCGWYGSGYMV